LSWICSSQIAELDQYHLAVDSDDFDFRVGIGPGKTRDDAFFQSFSNSSIRCVEATKYSCVSGWAGALCHVDRKFGAHNAVRILGYLQPANPSVPRKAAPARVLGFPAELPKSRSQQRAHMSVKISAFQVVAHAFVPGVCLALEHLTACSKAQRTLVSSQASVSTRI